MTSTVESLLIQHRVERFDLSRPIEATERSVSTELEQKRDLTQEIFPPSPAASDGMPLGTSDAHGNSPAVSQQEGLADVAIVDMSKSYTRQYAIVGDCLQEVECPWPSCSARFAKAELLRKVLRHLGETSIHDKHQAVQILRDKVFGPEMGKGRALSLADYEAMCLQLRLASKDHEPLDTTGARKNSSKRKRDSESGIDLGLAKKIRSKRERSKEPGAEANFDTDSVGPISRRTSSRHSASHARYREGSSDESVLSHMESSKLSFTAPEMIATDETNTPDTLAKETQHNPQDNQSSSPSRLVVLKVKPSVISDFQSLDRSDIGQCKTLHAQPISRSEEARSLGSPSATNRPLHPNGKSAFVQLKKSKARIAQRSSRRAIFETEKNKEHYQDLQTVKCLGACYKKSTTNIECAACTSRIWSSGGCRFIDIRKFASDFSYVLVSQKPDESPSHWIPRLTVPGSDDDASFLLQRIATPLVEMLQHEQRHQENVYIQRKLREHNTRAVCDGCATTIFSGHWVCYICGREYCLDCYDEWLDDEDLESYHQLNTCKRKKNEPPQAHTKALMVPYTRFQDTECDELLKEAIRRRDEMPEIVETGHTIAEGSGEILTLNNLVSMNDPAEGLPYAVGHIDHVSLRSFQAHWAKGTPLSLSGFSERFKLQWTPDYFIEHYGSQPAELVDIINREVLPSSVREFFSGLQSGARESMQHLKLNDWPDVEDFSLAMPDLFNDFEQALPFPKYTRRGGFLNLAAWFPPEYLPPDLGPKLYCAGASSDEDGAQGTTVLHMDMTDAVNIMTWSGPRPQNRRGSAVWDVFPQTASDALRRYLLDKLRRSGDKMIMDDPIRRARFYLHAGDLVALEKEHNVKPWRIYQNPGEAVFIPAGCAHQVCNLTPCIKVACDFVSPENVHRCSAITLADRRLAALAKREDVLQLKNVIYFAFVNVLHRNDPRPTKLPEVVDLTDSVRRRSRPKAKPTQDTQESPRPVNTTTPEQAVSTILSKMIADYGTEAAWQGIRQNVRLRDRITQDISLIFRQDPGPTLSEAL